MLFYETYHEMSSIKNQDIILLYWSLLDNKNWNYRLCAKQLKSQQ